MNFAAKLGMLLVVTCALPAVGCAATEGSEQSGVAEDAIVGGDRVAKGEQPWAGLLERATSRTATPVRSLCGVSLIDRTHVVTAAHCIASPANAGLLAYPVLSVVFPQVSTERFFVREVKLDARHKVYAAGATLTDAQANERFASDIAVLELEKATNTTPVGIAPDLDDSVPATGGVCDANVIGFGRTSSSAYDRTGPVSATGYGGTTVGRRSAQCVFLNGGAYVTQSAEDATASALCVGDSGSGLYRKDATKERILGLYYGSVQSEDRQKAAPGTCEPNDAGRWSFFVPISASLIDTIKKSGKVFSP